MKTISKTLPAILAVAILFAAGSTLGQPTQKQKKEVVTVTGKAQRTGAAPTPKPAESSNLNSGRSQPDRSRVAPSPTPKPVEASSVKSSKSNSSDRQGVAPTRKPSEPTTVKATRSSESSFRGAATTTTPDPAKGKPTKE
jgi:hypothetical protein